MLLNKRLLVASAIALAIVSNPDSSQAAPHYSWEGSYKAVVDQTAAVIEGTVVDIGEAYSEDKGPRTLVTLEDIEVLWGELKDSSRITLQNFGGSVPGFDGRVVAEHIPTFAVGTRYVLFLSNRDWRLSPVTGRQAFIVEHVYGKDILVTRDGYAVRGIDESDGPIRQFPVYRIPEEIDENFVPSVEESVTADKVTTVYSPEELVIELKEWARQRDIGVSGAFNSEPYVQGPWNIVPVAPDPIVAATIPAKELQFAPQPGNPIQFGPEEIHCEEDENNAGTDSAESAARCPEGEIQ